MKVSIKENICRRQFRWSFDRLEDAEEHRQGILLRNVPISYLIQKRANY